MDNGQFESNERITFYTVARDDLPFVVQMCGVSYCQANYMLEKKFSSNYAFEYITAGHGLVRENDRVYNVGPGDAYILHKGCHKLCRPTDEKGYAKIWINVDGKLLPGLLSAYAINDVVHIPNSGLHSYFSDMISLCSQNNILSESEIFDRCAVIVTKMVQEIAKKMNPARCLNHDALRIKNLIDRRNQFRLTIDQIAEQMHMTPSYIIRIFKNEFGMTPYEYHLQKKFHSAEFLLRNTRMSIKEISYHLEFTDEHYFSYCFKKRYGISPKEYRNTD